jgi:dTMP kinase
MSNGLFISFDGPDGGGKTTQYRRFSQYLGDQGYTVTCVREPGGTEEGEMIRKIILDPSYKLNSLTELFLFNASRVQLLDQIIRPALERGEIVLADRFTDATLAYQSNLGGGDLPYESVRDVLKLATGGLTPHRSYFIYANPEIAAKRIGKEGKPDRIESKGIDYQEMVMKGFMEIASNEPDRICLVDTSRTNADDAHKMINGDFHSYLYRSGLVGKLKRK